VRLSYHIDVSDGPRAGRANAQAVHCPVAGAGARHRSAVGRTISSPRSYHSSAVSGARSSCDISTLRSAFDRSYTRTHHAPHVGHHNGSYSTVELETQYEVAVYISFDGNDAAALIDGFS